MAEVVVVMSSDEQKLWRAQQKLLEQQTRMAQGYSRVKKEAKDAGKDAENSFGASAVAKMAAYAGGLVSIHQGIRQIAAVWQEVEESQRKALDSMQAQAESERALMQVARGGTVAEVQADFRAMADRADQLAAASSGMGRAAARELVFNARSAGFEDALDFIASTGAVISPSAAGEVAGRGPRLFEDQVTPTQAIVGTLAAAEQALFNFEQLAQALPTAALGGQALGASPQETLAVLSVFADRLKSPLQAAERMNLFGATIARDEDLAGRGFVGAFDALRSMDEEARREILGRSIGLAGFMRTMEAGMADVESRRVSVSEAMEGAEGADSMIALRREAMEAEAGTRLSVERARMRDEIENERRHGEFAAQRELTRLENARRFRESDAGPGAIATRIFDKFGEWVEVRATATLGENFMQAHAEHMARQARQFDTGDRGDLRDAAASLRDAAQALSDRSPDDARSLSAPAIQREANMHSVGVE